MKRWNCDSEGFIGREDSSGATERERERERGTQILYLYPYSVHGASILVGNIFLHHLCIPFLFIYSRMGCMKFPS